jgi:carbonic anhydrase
LARHRKNIRGQQYCRRYYCNNAPEVAMHRRQTLKLIAGVALCPLCSFNGSAEEAHWSYEGARGPKFWADIDPTNKACALGNGQSPINISDSIRARLTPLKVSWARRASTIQNNGHTIQVNVDESSKLAAPSGNFTLVQFHFHHPSEHQFNGKTFPMEAHFVHSNPSGSLAVIGVMMESGKANAVFKKIVMTMPATEGVPVKADTAINPNGLLPRKLAYYRYSGSLTTPPCAETVDWLVLTDSIQVGSEDIDAFAKLYEMNARPVQSTNRRFVLLSG